MPSEAVPIGVFLALIIEATFDHMLQWVGSAACSLYEDLGREPLSRGTCD